MRVESGAVDVLPCMATPRMPLEGAVVEMVWTDGMVLPEGSCLEDFSMKMGCGRDVNADWDLPVVVTENDLIHHVVPFPV